MNNLNTIISNDAWDALSLAEKAEMMRVAVNNGITDLQEIRKQYNEFAEGGDTESSWSMQDEANYRQWRSSLPDNLRDTNDNDYDMRGAFKAGMQPILESDGKYHLQSRDPKTGRILKAPHHPTYIQAINTDAKMGYYPIVDGKGQTYTQTWKGNLFGKGGSKDDDLVDWIIKEEGFSAKPENIGDGKITLGSGLTNPKWHQLYKKRGNKWSASDNRRAVQEEVANRRRWAEKNVPNWNYLPDSSQKALLSYKYNYDFNRTNSPKLFQALADHNYTEAARQMNATSKDSKFKKGLQARRKREQKWFLNDFMETTPTASSTTSSTPTIPSFDIVFTEPAASTNIFNPYVQQATNTQYVPLREPASDSYIETVEVTPEEQRRRRLQQVMEAHTRFNNIMELIRPRREKIPQFIPDNFLDNYNIGYSRGGKISIKPENRGKFTRLKERTGHSTTWFKEHGTPAQKKMATFALNARHWKHGFGGNLFDGGGFKETLLNTGLWIADKLGISNLYKGEDSDTHYRTNLYNAVDPTAGYPNNIFEAIEYKNIADNARKQNVYFKKRRGTDDFTADAAWAKRLGLPYEEKYLPSNKDGSVRLPSYIEEEIPVDTTFLKNRITANEALKKKYRNLRGYSGERRDALVAALKADKEALDSLRHTFATGEPVVINELAHINRNWIDNGVINIKPSPLNTLKNYTIRYNKKTGKMEYNDIYDFNQFENFVPGKPFNIRGILNVKPQRRK